jgi:hypothetical protein
MNMKFKLLSKREEFIAEKIVDLVSVLVFLSILTCLLLKPASIELFYKLCGFVPLWLIHSGIS